MQRRGMAAVLAVAVLAAGVSAWAQDVTKYVRYEHEGTVSYGILEGETIHQLAGDVFASPERTGATVALGDVTLLAPTDPRKVVAAGLNYRSHLGGAEPAEYPGLFDKHATSLIGHGAEITYYEDASNLHFEGEMVLIIGKTARNVSVEDAPTTSSPWPPATTSASASGRAATCSGSARRAPTRSGRSAR